MALLTALAGCAVVAREPLATALVRPGWRRAPGVADVARAARLSRAVSLGAGALAVGVRLGLDVAQTRRARR